MVNESVVLQAASFELATFGEVIYAFSALRSTSGRRRGSRAGNEVMPWGETLAESMSSARRRRLSEGPLPPRRNARSRSRTNPLRPGALQAVATVASAATARRMPAGRESSRKSSPTRITTITTSGFVTPLL